MRKLTCFCRHDCNTGMVYSTRQNIDAIFIVFCIFVGPIPFCSYAEHHFVIHDEIIRQIWNGENPINYSQPRYIDKGYPHTHINSTLVKAILKYVKPKFWLEVGSMLGGSAILTANVIKELNMNTSLVCVDPFTGQSKY